MLYPKLFQLHIILLCIHCMKSTRTPTVFCHYLPWYTIQQFQYNQVREGWCGHGTDCLNTSQTQYNSAGPLIGEYTQLEDHVLEYHLLLAQAAGIDAFIVNINPLSTLQLEIVKKLYDVATKLFQNHSTSFNLKLLLSYDNSKATTQTLIDADFLVLSNLFDSINDLDQVSFVDDNDQVNGGGGGSVILLWSENNPQLVYTAAKTMLGTNSIVLARSPRAFAESDGNFVWVNPIEGIEQIDSYWGLQPLKDFEWGMANNQNNVDSTKINMLSMGAVYPGFDDTKVPVDWNNGNSRHISRNIETTVGNSKIWKKTYDLTWEHVLDYAPKRYGGSQIVTMPWIQIVTWNDWPEGTAIEPSAGVDGNLAYNATYDFVKRWHEGSSTSTGVTGATGTTAVAAAVGILNARRQERGVEDEVVIEAAVGKFMEGKFLLVLSMLNTLNTGSTTPSVTATPSVTTTPSVTATTTPSASVTATPSTTIMEDTNLSEANYIACSGVVLAVVVMMASYLYL